MNAQVTKVRYTHMGCKVVTYAYKSPIWGLVIEIELSTEDDDARTVSRTG